MWTRTRMSYIFIDLIPFGHSNFNVIVGMDWLSKLKAKIVCFEKILQIPLSNREILEFHGERPRGGVKFDGLAILFRGRGVFLDEFARVLCEWICVLQASCSALLGNSSEGGGNVLLEVLGEGKNEKLWSGREKRVLAWNYVRMCGGFVRGGKGSQGSLVKGVKSIRVIFMDTAYGSRVIRRIGNWSNALSCEVQALIRRISFAGYGVLVRDQQSSNVFVLAPNCAPFSLSSQNTPELLHL
ncbi:hypothetical protein Tco_0651610 [Tanacetum coccineum]|uniref:Uncharacterized protein n=1 Tax=Tanacetum coccineum TaxID=301880 RepID=A0ABQ4WVA4_9ASTR